ncbi:metallophosphoesterase family protein [Natronomonas sp. EA1]|uniref:metallophosphoesterase family protein n=1 Tax=Natronomonas sp. EA1 TaxID=3421655 RepID=UPI003EBEA1D3
MKLGLISDIHANLPALEAVLADMPTVDELVCAGDVVGYNPWPGACVDIVRERCSAVVQGNHDRTVSSPERYRHNEMAYAGLRHAREQLTPAQREWLDGLPRTQTLSGNVLLVHDHPTQQDRYVYPHSVPGLRTHIDSYRGCVLGHSHVQFAERVEGRLVLNPGSVGQPRDGDPEAAYAVLDTDTLDVDLRRVPYDVDRVVQAIADAGLPHDTGARLRRGE